MKLAPRLALALLMAATLATGKAEDALDPEALRIATRFVKLAGSEDNAVALALALHHGKPVQLLAEGDETGALPEAITVETPTGPMSWHDVRIALLHAQDVLLRAGYTRPPPGAVQVALVGGELDGPQGHLVVRGVLQMRVEGLSWVDIARVTSPSSAAPAFLGR